MYTPNVVKNFEGRQYLKNATYRKIMMRTDYANYSNVYEREREREREKREILIIRRLELVYGRLIKFFLIKKYKPCTTFSVFIDVSLKRMRV